MVNTEIVSHMKRLIDELTDEEFDIIRNYCESKAIAIRRKKEAEHVGNSLAATMLKAMISMHENI